MAEVAELTRRVGQLEAALAQSRAEVGLRLDALEGRRPGEVRYQPLHELRNLNKIASLSNDKSKYRAWARKITNLIKPVWPRIEL